MTTPSRDRNYYRLESNESLITEARENPGAELAIVLAERLRTAEWECKELQYLRDELDSVTWGYQ
jgi:hypothetical protein